MTSSTAINRTAAPTAAPIPAHGGRAALHLVTSRPRLLLMQDIGADVRSDLATMLDGAGFDVVGQADNGAQTAAMATDLRPDAALFLAGQPQSGGHPTADRLYAADQLGRRHTTPVVMLAKQAEPDLIKDALAAGVMGYVVEPFTQERVLPAIEMAVARHAEAAALRNEVTQISQRLDARKVIERAKGLLMTQENMTEPAAFRFIQRTAMDRRVSMRDVASALVDRMADNQGQSTR